MTQRRQLLVHQEIPKLVEIPNQLDVELELELELQLELNEAQATELQLDACLSKAIVSSHRAQPTLPRSRRVPAPHKRHAHAEDASSKVTYIATVPTILIAHLLKTPRS